VAHASAFYGGAFKSVAKLHCPALFLPIPSRPSTFSTSNSHRSSLTLRMRLLKLEDDGEFSLTEFVGNKIPRYAILSHTWGADDEEPTFKDLVNGTGKSKAGYEKIRFCEKQAAKDDLRYFWVDTVCIDKSSSAELAEAINSMFRWYHDAAKCYAYLSDVSMGSAVGINLSSKSRWFTRSWTLQELLAPASVEFFSAEGKRLGDRNSLLQEIHNVTGISIQALQGSSLSQFSVDERLSWAKGREAKREEDAAYSLLGMFDVYMPLIYGEGQQKAFIRLHREIEQSSAKPARSMEETRIGKPTSSSFKNYGPGSQFNTLGGTQHNNTGSGNQVLGSFSGPVHFG